MNSIDTNTDLLELSRQLLREFLALEQQGCSLPRSLVLFGGPEDVRTLVGKELEREIALSSHSELKLSLVNGPLKEQQGAYQIDLGYFCAEHPCREFSPQSGTLASDPSGK